MLAKLLKLLLIADTRPNTATRAVAAFRESPAAAAQGWRPQTVANSDFARPHNEECAEFQPIPQADAVYRSDSRFLALLRACGLRRIFGVFDSPAWAQTCRDVGLYRLPLHGRVACDLTSIMVAADNARLADWFEPRGGSTLDYAADIIKRAPVAELLPIIMPDGEPRGSHVINLTFPQPPAHLMDAMHMASLHGLKTGIAAPAEAIHVQGVAVNPAWLRDPIVFAEKPDIGRTVILGYYAASPRDPERVKSLIRVLTIMSAEL